MKAIETLYEGYRFRSRLEARWAVFLTTLGVHWEYEKEGYVLPDGSWYLPDFWLPITQSRWPSAGYWLEVKGQAPTPEELHRCACLAQGTGDYAFLVQGAPGGPYHYWSWEENGEKRCECRASQSDSRHGLLALPLEVRISMECGQGMQAIPQAVEAARSARFEFSARNFDTIFR